MAEIRDTGKAAVVVVARDRTAAAVVERVTPVDVSSPGVQGPKGNNGSSGAGYTHQQSVPSDDWLINHNLGFRPSVDLFDSGGSEFDAEVIHVSENTLRVRALVPVAGFARLT